MVKEDVSDGYRLIEALEKKDFQVTAALWLYEEEKRLWRLIIASPYYDEKGPREAYLFIANIIEDLSLAPELDLFNITVVSKNDRRILNLNNAIKVKDNPSGVRFSRSYIDDAYIDDALIYRSGSEN